MYFDPPENEPKIPMNSGNELRSSLDLNSLPELIGISGSFCSGSKSILDRSVVVEERGKEEGGGGEGGGGELKHTYASTPII